MPISIKYADGTPIEPCGTPRDLSKLGFEVQRKGLKLDAEIVTYIPNDFNFSELYTLWLRPCIDAMGKNGQDSYTLFTAEADKDQCAAFLEELKDYLYFSGEPLIYNVDSDRIEELCKSVDKRLPRTPAGICLRIKCICLLLRAIEPEQLFAEGVNWYLAFQNDNDDGDTLRIRDGMDFVIDYSKEPDQIYPRTLKNGEDHLTKIKVHFQDKEYVISFPPKGFLRAVFGDPAGKRLLSIKGNISVGTEGDDNAAVQKSSKGTPVLMQMFKGRFYDIGLEGGLLRDAAVNERFLLALTDRGLFSTETEEELDVEKLPVRLYAAGPHSARLYADGSLESSLFYDTGRPVENAMAVAEDGGRNLLIRDREHAWSFTGGNAIEIPDAVFVETMLARFSVPGCCEQVQTDWVTIMIDQRGEVRNVK